jgi:hypothetical protein
MQLKDFLNVALEVKSYVEQQDKTLPVSKGKMLSDSDWSDQLPNNSLKTA